MQVRIRETGAVMYIDEFRAYQHTHGGPSWGTTTTEVLDSLGADVVLEGPQASPTRYQISFADGVEQDAEGRWFTKYSVSDMDADAIAAKDAEQATNVRNQRTQLLKDCDWTQIADSTADKTAWATYRQALRDVPAQSGFPWEVTWPTQP